MWRPAIANLNVTATVTQMPRDRLAACAYCRRLLGRALQNELCFISYSATQLEIEFKLLSLELKS